MKAERDDEKFFGMTNEEYYELQRDHARDSEQVGESTTELGVAGRAQMAATGKILVRSGQGFSGLPLRDRPANTQARG